MKILYQYRSSNLDATPKQSGLGCDYWPDDPFNYHEVHCEDSIPCRLSHSIQSPCNTVNLMKHIQYDSASVPTVSSYSRATRNENCPNGMYKDSCHSIDLPVSMALSKYVEVSSSVRLSDRNSQACVTVYSFNPKTNGCWSHTTTSRYYSKDAVSNNTMEVL